MLNKLGIKVLRYDNSEVMTNIEGVYENLIGQIKIRERELGIEKSLLDKGELGIWCVVDQM